MNTENKNLYIMKLLTSSDEFKADMAELRIEFSIPRKGFLNNDEAKRWDDKLIRESDNFLDSAHYKEKVKKLLALKGADYRKFLKESEALDKEIPLNKFRDRIEKITTKYRLPYNFLRAVEMYAYHNKISPVFLPLSNFSVTIDPSGRKNTARWVELRTYARLTEKEIREAVKTLRGVQERYLQFNLSRDIRAHKDIDLAIKIESDIKDAAMGNYDFRFTSEEIAEDVLGSSAKNSHARQMYHRLKKERGKLFGI